MRYDKNKTQKRLKGVPIENRSFIYDATILLEFLNQTLMPNSFFETPEGKALLPQAKISHGDLYDYYKMFRQQKDYTHELESRYKFSVMMSKLLLMKNGWQFERRRIGRGQIVYFSPCILRVKVDTALRKMFPPAKIDMANAVLKVTKEDHEDPRDDDLVADILDAGMKTHYTKDNFVEAEYELPEDNADGY